MPNSSRFGEADIFQNGNADYNLTYSPLTKLRTRTLFGRPNFKQIFTSITHSIENTDYLPGREASLKVRFLQEPCQTIIERTDGCH